MKTIEVVAVPGDKVFVLTSSGVREEVVTCITLSEKGARIYEVKHVEYRHWVDEKAIGLTKAELIAKL